MFNYKTIALPATNILITGDTIEFFDKRDLSISNDFQFDEISQIKEYDNLKQTVTILYKCPARD